MEITYKDLKNVSFPVFILPSDNWSERDGLIYLEGEILDDRNMPGNTLGLRRLQSPFKNMIKLKKSLNDQIGILKQPPLSYIDNKGRLFRYRKTKFAQLKYYKIKKIELKTVACIIWLSGINFPFKQARPPLFENTWAGVLHINGIPWVIYEFSTEKQSDTKRKI